MAVEWLFEPSTIDWAEMSELYRIAPLGDKPPEHLQRAFANSMFMCFLRENGVLVGAGRMVSDGIDVAYLCDVIVHPAHQGTGLGKAIVLKLKERCGAPDKILLYAAPGKEPFYRKLGFRRMLTAMAIFRDEERALRRGLVE